MWGRVTRQRFFDAMATCIVVAEVGFLGGRPFVLAFAAALYGLRFTLPDRKGE